MNKKYLTALAFITLANVTNATAVSSDSAPESLDSIISAEFHRRSELISSESNGFTVFQGEFNAEKKRIDAQSLSAKFKQAQATVEEQKSQLQRRPSVAEALDSGYTGDITEIGEATRRMHERKNFLQEIFHNVSNKVKSDPFLSKNLDIIRTLAELEISNSCCYLILLPKVSINDIYLAIDHIVDDASKKGIDLTTEEFFGPVIKDPKWKC